jgi:hypothetical protein
MDKNEKKKTKNFAVVGFGSPLQPPPPPFGKSLPAAHGEETLREREGRLTL